jgi:hypothetical protein
MFDEDGNQVDVSDLQLGPYQIMLQRVLIQVGYQQEQAFFKKGADLENRVCQRFGLDTMNWYLTHETELMTANDAQTGVEYQVKMGRISFVYRQNTWTALTWDSPQEALSEEKLIQLTSLEGLWELEQTDGTIISRSMCVQGERYRLTRTAKSPCYIETANTRFTGRQDTGRKPFKHLQYRPKYRYRGEHYWAIKY